MSHQPCGTCSNCTLALENRHVDIIEMDGASSRKIDDIRDLIEQTKYKPSTARYKIFIIDEVHMLTKEAFNALLKTLEEPPEYVKFVLATTDPLKLPATILSRTQHFRFKSIATNKIIDHLAHILNLEGIEFELDALEILARSGSGSLRDTLTLLDQAIIYSKKHVDVRTVTDMLGLVDPKFISELFGAVFAKDYARLVELTKVLEDYEADMVVDELIAYLKDRMYAADALYSTLVLDRFFRILSDSKYLFSINADGSFVLSLIFFKMVEALRIKEVDQMIESLQKEISRPPIAHSMPEKTQQATTTESVKIQIQDETPSLHASSESSSESSQGKEVNRLEESQPNTTTQTNKQFEDLVAKIKDRNYELGECFEKSISFVSYVDSALTWESCADEECKKSLRHGWAAIKQLVREVFGFETKIKHQACSKEITTDNSSEYNQGSEPNKPKEFESKPVDTPNTTASIEQPTMSEPQSTSMVEDAEIGGSASCVTNCDSSDSSKEIDAVQMKDEPMVQKAVELFEAKKMTIQSKI
jgi:DNA polymerase-3 subunit gamma/tau